MNKFKEMSLDDLKKYFKDIIEKIKKKYNFFDIPTDVFNNLVNNILEDIQNLDREISEAYFESELDNKINEYILELMNSANYAMNIIVKYIEQNFKNDSLKDLKSLSLFLSDVDYDPSIDVIIDVIKTNNKLNNCIKNVINSKFSNGVIESNSLNNLFSNEIEVCFIEAYASLNDIEIVDDLSMDVKNGRNSSFK